MTTAPRQRRRDTRNLRSYEKIAERIGLSPQRIQQIIQAVFRALWRRGLRPK